MIGPAMQGNRGDQCVCYLGVGATLAPESATHNATPKNHLSQFTVNRVQTSKVLIEGGFTYLRNPFGFPHHSGVTERDIPRTEISTGFTWNARSSIQLPYTDYDGPGGGLSAADQTNMRGSLSYVTGSHTFKAGFSQAHGWVEQNGRMNELAGFGPVSFRLLNGRPNGIVVYASPKYSRSEFRNTSFYVQDQWTMNPLTVSMGVRADMFDGWTPEQTTPAGVFVPAFTMERIERTPRWRNVSPRLGLAYDLSGDGKTALKAAAGRYVASAGAGIVQNANPILAVVTSATRTWNDVDADFFPDAAELGPLSDLAFGTPRITTRYADDVFLENRPYTWQMSASLERELRDNMGLSVSYFRTAHFNQTLTDNTLVQPSDFDQYCVAVPADSRLPGGGGGQLCGLYNVSFARAGQTNNLVRFDRNFGDETEVYHGMDAQVNARFARGASVQGGFSIGRTVRDNCVVVDSPQALHFCRVVTPIARNGQVKASGMLPLPYGFEVAAVYQFLPGAAVLANGVFTNAQVAPSLGRNLSNCPAATGACNATVTVPMIQPNTISEKHINQLDFRVAKLLRGPFGRVRATLDLYNALNNAAVLGRNNTFGPAWGTPTRLLGGRLIKLGAQYSF